MSRIVIDKTFEQNIYTYKQRILNKNFKRNRFYISFYSKVIIMCI